MDSVIVSAEAWMRILRLARRAEATGLGIAVIETEYVASSADFADVKEKKVGWVSKTRADDLYCRYLAAVAGDSWEDEPTTKMEWAAKALGEIDKREEKPALVVKTMDELLAKISVMCDESISEWEKGFES